MDNFIISTSYDKTAKAWLLDADVLREDGGDDFALVRSFEGHRKAVFPLAFIPDENFEPGDRPEEAVGPGDVLITGSADGTARSWSFGTGACLKVGLTYKLASNCYHLSGVFIRSLVGTPERSAAWTRTPRARFSSRGRRTGPSSRGTSRQDR